MNHVFIRNKVKAPKDTPENRYINNFFVAGKVYESTSETNEGAWIRDVDGDPEYIGNEGVGKYFHKVPVQTNLNGSEVNFLGGGRFLQVYSDKETGYEMFHEPAWNDFGVGILAQRYNSEKLNEHGEKGAWEYLMVMEARPCHGKGHRLYSTKGGMEPNMTPKQCAIKELLEETGYIVSEEDVIDLGEVWLTTMSSGKMAVFAVDVTFAEKGERKPDGSAVEATAFSEWVDRITLIRQGDNLASRMLNLSEVYGAPETEDEKRIKRKMAMTAHDSKEIALEID